jgi:hypothetical protein
LFLASKAACNSPYVQQELGAALITEKKIVPIVGEIEPSELPGWMNQSQALNLAGVPPEKIRYEISRIAETIRADKRKGPLIAGLLVAGLIAFSIN